jgi:peptidoglycan/xylan/chitin deacetylase (PgdA/CDA1 family)
VKACIRQVLGRSLLIHLPILSCLVAGQWHLALIVFGLTFVVMTYGILSPTTRLFGPVTTHVPPPGVLITIDDGPDSETTSLLLDLLDHHGVKAVFFLIGDRVRRWPHLAKEIVARGHAIGNHSQTHPAHRFWSLGPWRMWRELAGCQQTLKEVLGAPAVWFRAPVGHFNSFTHPVARALGLRIMSWSCRGFDGRDKNVERVLRRIRGGLKPGAIVLLHEAMPSSTAVLEGTLQALRTKGLSAASPQEYGAR